MLVAVVAALTLGPAVVVVGSRFGLFDPKRKMKTRFWRRVGTAVVRWPGPILVASTAIALVGLLALPAYKTNYDSRMRTMLYCNAPESSALPTSATRTDEFP